MRIHIRLDENAFDAWNFKENIKKAGFDLIFVGKKCNMYGCDIFDVQRAISYLSHENKRGIKFEILHQKIFHPILEEEEQGSRSQNESCDVWPIFFSISLNRALHTRVIHILGYIHQIYESKVALKWKACWIWKGFFELKLGPCLAF